MPFTILNKDITKMEVDAIVNSTNNFSFGSGGADYDIYQAAGLGLIQERTSIGDIPPLKAIITKGYNLPAKHVIHVVAPRFIDGNHNEEQLLEETYLSAMLLAYEQNIESLAFPLISSGSLGFPWQKALKIALTSVSRFLEDHEMMIYVLVYEEPVPYDISSDSFLRRIDRFQRRSTRSETELINSLICYDIDLEQSIDDEVGNLDETFSDAIMRMIDERDLSDSYVYKKANVDKKLFSKIRCNPDYQPSKVTAIALALALELNLEETNNLSAKAGFTLSTSQHFDKVIIYYIIKGNYDLYEINATLFSFGLKMIGLE